MQSIFLDVTGSQVCEDALGHPARFNPHHGPAAQVDALIDAH